MYNLSETSIKNNSQQYKKKIEFFKNWSLGKWKFICLIFSETTKHREKIITTKSVYLDKHFYLDFLN